MIMIDRFSAELLVLENNVESIVLTPAASPSSAAGHPLLVVPHGGCGNLVLKEENILYI